MAFIPSFTKAAPAAILAALLFVFSMPAFAVSIDVSKIPALRTYDASKEAFEAATDLVREEKPYNDENLGYSIRLPKGWTENVQAPPVALGSGANPLSDTVLGILGRYIAPPKNFQRSSVTVEAVAVKYEISMKDWFVNFIVSNGFSLSAMTEKSPQEIEALYIQTNVEHTFVVRARVIVSGSRLVIVRHYLPQDNYEDGRVEQAQIIESFALLNALNERIEKQAVYGFLDQSFFNYPQSWNLRDRSILTIERMGVSLAQNRIIGDPDDRRSETILEGHMRVQAVSRLLNTTLAQEVEKFRNEIQIPDYKIGGLIETITYKYHPDIRAGKAQAYHLVPDRPRHMKAYELAVTVMEGQDYYYITSLITPSRTQDYYLWARNMEAYRIVNESVRRTNAPVLP
ncbi:MAG: hypothetical protein WC989_01690 [Micavibrio sp.]